MNGDPLDGASWIEHELTRLTWPINAQPIDLDRDGDRDIVGRSVVWLEQPASPGGQWTLHEIGQYGPDDVVGLSVADVNGDGRPDVMSAATAAAPGMRTRTRTRLPRRAGWPASSTRGSPPKKTDCTRSR